MKVTFRPSSFTSKQQQNNRRSQNTKHKRAPAPSLVQESQHESIIPEFINVTDTVSLDKSSKTKVRIQVMKDYHRRRVQEIDENRHATLDQISEPPAISAKAQTQKFRLGQERILRPWTPKKGGQKRKRQGKSEENRTLRKQTSPIISGRSENSRLEEILCWDENGNFVEPRETEYESTDKISPTTQEWILSLEYYLENSMLHQSPSGGMLDPFGAMSLLITPRTQRLLHHYFTLRLPNSWLMMPMRRAFLTQSLHDPALFHTFLSHYAASYHTAYSKTHKSDPDEAIYHRTMAIKIVNERIREKKDELSDGSVGAVANLAIYESANGTTESMLAHLAGLEEMVNLRGGLEHGGFNPHVRRLINWTDLNTASSLFTTPRFQLPPNTQVPLPYLISQIRDLSSTFAALRAKTFSPKEDIGYSDQVFFLQRSLYSIVHSSTASPLEIACAGAALVYCCHMLRDIPFAFTIVVKAVKRLKEVLLMVDLEQEKNEEWLFWILGFGSVGAERKEEWPWFVEKFARMCRKLGVRCWTEMRERLSRVLWGEALDERGLRVWREVELVLR